MPSISINPGILISLLLSAATHAHATEALVAVATNFSEVAAGLKSGFESGTNHRITITTGSTGKLYAQILNGAPFDVLLAADQVRPRLLEDSGSGMTGSRFTYALGRLAAWSPDRDIFKPDLSASITQDQVRSLAIANPLLAPYGMASKQALQALGTWDVAREKIVMGENVGQAYALVATGNAEIGFVAMSYVMQHDKRQSGSYVEVDAALHDPIRQDAVLLAHGAQNDAAHAFLAFLRSDEAQDFIRSRGYGSE